MFTGIIEEVGRIASVEPLGGGLTLTIAAATVTEGMRKGNSIAVDGVCQTVTEFGADSFGVQAVATTLQRTTFGSFAPGCRVNLERSLRLADRLGGHLVQGHVDGVGEVRGIEPRGEYVLIDFVLPPEIAEVTILHGSIALNGVSLTINAFPSGTVAQVSIVPYTWEHTALADLRPGDRLNLEGDMIGKHVRRLIEGRLPRR